MSRQIDHDPNERPVKPLGFGFWGPAWIMVGLLWAGYIYSFTPDFIGVLIGTFTGAVFIAFLDRKNR